ncbi:hypothetical protein DL546_005731 [Coniochaeta pulveracea]|uniref:Uncharacterized protein n=1 Tax=Coniochaeta pulveracea TaxID=177199 RepID=A0A420YES6_9PEZI|nr:hypothetical protein DL546_005731 [Coniochaeta pulveracea]
MVGKAKSKSSRSRSSISKSSLSKSSKSSKSKSGSTSSGSQLSEEPIENFDLYCAIYVPRAGNYYHWAFVVNDQTIQMPWHIFQVTQDEHDNYHPSYLQVDPMASDRCMLPLPHLGKMHPAWFETLAARIGAIQVPGEAMH